MTIADGEESYESADVDEAETAEAPAAQFKKVPNQRGVPGGEVRLYCNACSKSFHAAADDHPEICPEGHKAEEGNQEGAAQ